MQRFLHVVLPRPFSGMVGSGMPHSSDAPPYMKVAALATMAPLRL